MQIINFQGRNIQSGSLQGGMNQGVLQGGIIQGGTIQGGVIQGGNQIMQNHGIGQISPINNQITQIENKTIITTTLIW